jgi:4-hydroxy-3-polyprenylbenzoate decarboxylase
MPDLTLGEFLTALQDTGEVFRVAAAVDPQGELAAITQRVIERAGDGGPALLFTAVRNSAWPVVTNLLGQPRRLCRALGVDSFDALPELWGGQDPTSWGSPHGPPRGTPAGTKTIRQGACQQVVKLGRDVNVWELPTQRGWAGENHPTLSGGIAILPSIHGGRATLTPTPVQVVDRQRLLPLWTEHEPAARLARQAQTERRQLPVAWVFGGDPVISLAAELAPWFDQGVTYDVVGALRREPLGLVKCRSHDLEVPAEGELVIEGFVDPDVPWEPVEGVPLSNGYLSTPTTAPPIQVTAITHRANPIIPLSLPGPTPNEATQRLAALDRLMQPVIQRLSSAIVDFVRPGWGQGAVAIVSLRKTHPLAATTVGHALWSAPGLRFVKWIIAVDAEVPVQHAGKVWGQVALGVDPGRDVRLSAGPADPHDPAMAQPGIGGRILIDATTKTAGEGYPRPWPTKLGFSDEQQQKLRERWSELGLPERWGGTS